MLLLVMVLSPIAPAPAQTAPHGPPPPDAGSIRLAVFHTELSRPGPGLLLRDIRAGADDVERVHETIMAARPDIIVLLGMDHDLHELALTSFQQALTARGHAMPHRFTAAPNRGMATGLDMDGDGRTGTPDDAQGFGRFAGASGMAILSRWPIDAAGVLNHSAFLWRDLQDALLPRHDGRLFPSDAVFDIQRLASTGFWMVPVPLPDGTPLTLMTWHAGPPAFGGPHHRNRNRNHDETMFWVHLLDGRGPSPPPSPPFVLMGNANLDPMLGEGMHRAIRSLLAHPALQDPAPTAAAPPAAPAPVTATAHFPRGPGWLRGSYILPDAGLRVTATGLFWPPPPARHALVWVDIAPP